MNPNDRARRLGIKISTNGARTLGLGTGATNRAAQLGIGSGANARAARLGIGSALDKRAERFGLAAAEVAVDPIVPDDQENIA